MVMEEKPDVRKTHILERGEYDKKGEEVFAETPAALPPFKADFPKTALA